MKVAALALMALLARGSMASGLDDAAGVLRIALPLYAGALTLHEDDREGTQQWLYSTAATLGTTYAMKSLIIDERPDGSGDDAFPSGHAAAAFSGAAFVHRRYGLKRAAPAYALAAWTAWARVRTDDHDTGDVAAAAGLAIASAWWLAEPREQGVAVYPVLDGDAVGVAFRGRF